ncbi:MAG: flippase-like domain-containing protein [Deltaproteobacteria bacterium]|nr:flippase-like domain-containing protein [Deltaproteobacteria bacterium]
MQLAAVLGGLGLLGFLVWNVGVSEVAGHLRQIGWLAPLVLLPYIAVALCDAKGWACAIPFTAQAGEVPLWRLALARMAGEAVNNLTPTATIGGEPVKVYLLRAHGLTTDAGLASVVVAKTALTVSQIVFILLGLPFFLYRLGWVRQGWWMLGPLLVLAYGFVMLLIRWQRRGLMSMAARALRRLLPPWHRLEHWEERARRIDAHLLGFYDGNAREFIASTIYHFLGWMLGAVEVLFFFHLIGVSVASVDALIIETMLQPLTAAALIIPGSLGVQEAGGVFLCRLLGLDDGAGLTLMALKRAREAVYNLIGLAVLARVGGALLPRKAHSL